MTQDAMPADDFLLEELLLPFENEDIAITYARQLADHHSSEFAKISRKFNYSNQYMVKSIDDIETMGIKTYFCSNVCAAYRKSVYNLLQGFISHTIFNEDMIYAAKVIQAQYRIAYVPTAKVIHSHSYSNMQQLRRNFDLGVSQADHPEVFANIKSESEGIKFVKEATKQLKNEGKQKLLFSFYTNCAFKLIGYKLGKNYKKLPDWIIKKCTMNKYYWD